MNTPVAGQTARRRLPISRRWPETGCECRSCQLACLNSPGWFVPEEVPRLARHLALEVPDLFRRYLGLSITATATGEPRQGVMPHKLRDGKKPGSAWSLRELAVPGRCIFYDHGRCSIYSVRPFECSRMHHQHSSAKTARLRADVAASWTPEELAPYAALVREVSGHRRRRR